MHLKNVFRMTIAAVVFSLACISFSSAMQGRLPAAKSVRCVFPLNATGTWKQDGSPEAAVKPASLLLIFDTINADEGTAQLKNGTAGSEIIVRASEGYLNLIQSFRSGATYMTTVFDKESSGGKFKAVHSRHEYFTVPLAGSTSSPEQYYGECEVTR
jgi:hypothetical protein